MTKVKVYRDSTDDRYEGKQYVQFVGRFGPEYAQKVAPKVSKQWKERFGYYHQKYEELVAYLQAKYPDLPKGQYGQYRSFLFYALKNIPTGSKPVEVIDRFKRNLGLSTLIMDDILRHFGLLSEKPVKELKTNAQTGNPATGSTGAPAS